MPDVSFLKHPALTQLTWVSSLQGYKYNGDAKVFPIILGEFGSYLEDSRSGCAKRGCLPQEMAVRLFQFCVSFYAFLTWLHMESS